MSKSTIKFSLILGVVFIIIIAVISFIKPKSSSPNLPSPTSSLQSPISPNPSLIPPQSFTGADVNQELPPELKNVGEQKTALRRLTPLTLDFATIEFDYENDLFLVRLLDPKEENKIQFNSWKDQNYPALMEDKFIFN